MVQFVVLSILYSHGSGDKIEKKKGAVAPLELNLCCKTGMVSTPNTEESFSNEAQAS